MTETDAGLIDACGEKPVRTSWSRGWIVLFSLVAPINLLMSLDRQAMTLSAPRIQQQFGFSLVQISLIIACVLWTYALLQIPAGALVNRYGPRKCLFVGCLAWSIATILTPICSSFFGFMVVRLAMGVGQAPDWSSSIVAINNWFPAGRRAKANAVLLGFLYMGSVIGGPLLTQITAHWSWKLGFYIFGFGGVIWSCLWAVFMRDRPPEVQVAKGERTLLPGLPMKQLLQSRQFWSIGIHYMCLLTIQSFFLTLMPFYLMDHRHLQFTSMGWLYSMPWSFLYVSVFLSGMIADLVLRRTRSLWKARTPMGMIGTFCCGTLVLIGDHIQNIPVMIVIFSFALGCSGLSQISIWTSVQDLTRGQTGLVAGWTTFWGNAASGIAPIVMVYIVRMTGSWSTALLLPFVAGLIGSVCCSATHPERPIEGPVEGA
ncbi:MFS transporter [Gluconobacter frateurii]|nr:MFS transporter [Gluconobacter frateurii]GLP90666.1 MFS transporter [Gluconobacter frateurii]